MTTSISPRSVRFAGPIPPGLIYGPGFIYAIANRYSLGLLGPLCVEEVIA